MNASSAIILKYMIERCLASGRVGVQMPLLHLSKEGKISRPTFYRTINIMVEQRFIVKLGNDAYCLDQWAWDLIETHRKWELL